MQKNRQFAAVAGAAVAALAVTMASGSAQAKPLPTPHEPSGVTRSDNLPNPLADAQSALQQEAVTKLVQGKASTEIRGGERVIKLAGNKAKDAKGTKAAKDRYVRYPINRKESVFTILTDFGTQTMPAVGGTPGPAHNQIPEPDRNWDGSATDDNNTNWVADFDTQHYKDLLFDGPNSFKTFYQKQSNGRFQASGDVSDWVSVPYNEARVRLQRPRRQRRVLGLHQGHRLVLVRRPEGRRQDRRRDRDLPEAVRQGRPLRLRPRRQLQRAGRVHRPLPGHPRRQGEEAGGGAQGADAIWSHRWYAFSSDQGQTGPSGNLLGGVPLGTPASGSVTTPPSRRTAGSACSPTSSATTWGCPTSTTPPAATTAPASGRSCPAVPG